MFKSKIDSLYNSHLKRIIEKETEIVYEDKDIFETQRIENIYKSSIFQLNQDKLFNICYGNSLSNKIFPIIHDYYSDHSPTEIKYRSYQFLKEVLNDKTILEELMNTKEKEFKLFLLLIRDLYIYSTYIEIKQKVDSNEEIKQLLVDIKEIIQLIPDNKFEDNIDGLTFTYFPSKSRILPRFITIDQLKDKEIKSKSNIPNFIKLIEICENPFYAFYFSPNRILVFTNPEELSFHNYENIVNLNDYLFQNTNEKQLQLQTNGITTLNEGIFQLNIKFPNDLYDKLIQLDKLGIYSPVFNSSQRGGSRFIFSSTMLSDLITQSIKSLPNKLNNEIKTNTELKEFYNNLKTLEFVNYVFRYNKFKPGDNKFNSHFDTPYYSKAKKQLSKYTIIIYLTSGKASPVLKFDTENDSVEVNTIDSNNNEKGIYCIIFDHKYKHEGHPFIDNDKIFLRSELVFDITNDSTVINDKAQARLFNIACYMSKQSIFNKELNDYANECFNLSTEMKLAINRTSKDIVFKYIHKTYQNINFITNGNDYWFPLMFNQTILSMITIMDYFNAELKDNEKNSNLFFNKIMNAKEITFDTENVTNDVIFDYLNKLQDEVDIPFNQCLLRNYLFPLVPNEFEIENDSTKCCPQHHLSPTDKYVPMRSDYVKERYNELVNSKNSELFEKYEVSIFGQDLKINVNNYIIEEDRIIIDNKIPKVHFAGCETQEPQCWEVTNAGQFFAPVSKNYTCYNSIPPIYYKKFSKGFLLQLDLFNNQYIRVKEEKYEDIKIFPGEVGNISIL